MSFSGWTPQEHKRARNVGVGLGGVVLREVGLREVGWGRMGLGGVWGGGTGVRVCIASSPAHASITVAKATCYSAPKINTTAHLPVCFISHVSCYRGALGRKWEWSSARCSAEPMTH